ncbi:MAG: monovalent cation/H(+) antiporter subunit G [Bacteroidota bacterium]
MENYIVLLFLVIGTLFIFIASVGLLKMPDVYLRMSASTIAGTFGVASMLIAVAIFFGGLSLVLHVAGVIVFLILTVPVGAHMLGRTSHIIGLKMWDKTVSDDMKGKYNEETHGFKPEKEENK